MAAEHPWTVVDIGRNGISSLMSDPNERRAAAAQRPVETPQMTPIRRVRNSDFDPYLSLIADAYGRYEFNRAVGMEGMPTLADQKDSASFSELATMIGADPNAGRKDSYGMHRARSAAASVPPLSSVPPVFFQAGFNLENPHTFSLVCESGDGVAPGTGPVGPRPPGVTAGTSIGTTAGQQPESLVYSSSVLQEKLSHYLDTIEIHLVKEISRRSSSFFAALSNLQSLHAETLECVGEISQVRSRLASLAQNTSKQGLRVVRLKRRRANLAELLKSLNLIGELRQTQPMVQLLLGQNDYVGALDLIGDAFATIQGARSVAPIPSEVKAAAEPSAARELEYRSIRAIGQTYGQLSEVYRTIGLVMEAEFVSVLGAHVRESSAFGILSDVISKLSADPPLGAAELAAFVLAEPSGLLERISPTLRGLVHTRKIIAALRAFKDVAKRDLKSVTKEFYRTIGNAGDKSAILAGKSALALQLRSMTFDAFFSLLARVYASHLIFLKRTTQALKLVTDAIDELDERAAEEALVPDLDQFRLRSGADVPPPEDLPRGADGTTEEMDEVDALNDGGDYPEVNDTWSAPASRPSAASPGKTQPIVHGLELTTQVVRTLSDLYEQVKKEAATITSSLADLSHARCAKLLSVRSEFNSQLNAKDFRRLYVTTWSFLAATDVISSKPTLGLKGAITNQSRSFVRNFHEEKLKQIALLIESEPWTQAAVPAEFQLIADGLCGTHGIVKDNLSASALVAKPNAGSEKMLTSVNSRPSEDGSAPRASMDGDASSDRCLVINGQRYYAVGCVLIFIKMISDYLQCLDDVPIAVTEIIHDLLEILAVFNSRICQVILGAGAVASLGLKNITAKHLALASQSIAIVIALIPAIRANLEPKLVGRQATVLLGDFERKLKDYKEHQNQIYAKLVSIMSDRLAIHMKAMHGTAWSQPSPDGKPNAYMLALVKDLVTLHKVLSKYLSNEILQRIVGEVVEIYNARLEEEIGNLAVPSSAAKERLLADVQFYVQELGVVSDVVTVGNRLTIAVNNLKVQAAGFPGFPRSSSPLNRTSSPQVAPPSSPGNARRSTER